MTAIQYVNLMTKLIRLENDSQMLKQSVLNLVDCIKSLTDKTVVISSVQNDIDKLKLEVKSVKDELEA